MSTSTVNLSLPRFPGILFVALLHAGLISALIMSLGRVPAPVFPGPFVTDVVVEPSTPPPTPSVVIEPPTAPSFADPPVVSFAGDASGAIHTATLVAPAALPGHMNRRPDYPEASLRLGEEGSVVLLLLVDENGGVADGRIESSSGFARLDMAALTEAKRSYRFRPGTEDGRPKAMWHRMKVTFRLEDARG